MFARTQIPRLEEAKPQRIRQRSEDIQLALLLIYITLGWMTIEGAASLLLGWASKSLLLESVRYRQRHRTFQRCCAVVATAS